MRNLFAWLFLLYLGVAAGQSSLEFKHEADFINYLITAGDYRGAIYMANQLKKQNNGAGGRADTLNYLCGWAYYNRKILDSSAAAFELVTPASIWYSKTRFYCAINYAYLKKNAEALSIFEKSSRDSLLQLQKLARFELAGLALLERKYTRFDSLSGTFEFTDYAFSQEEKDLIVYGKKMRAYKRKSPFVAGALSALVPGLGKFYAGKKGQALAVFAMCAVLGAVTAENYIKDGPRSPGFITFGTVFSMFYLGNIWGSALSVKMARQSFYRTKENEILVTMHIPLRRVFN